HAAQGPTPARVQAPPVVVDCRKKCEGPSGLQVFRSVIIAGDMTVDGWLADYIGHEVLRHQHLLEALRADQQ
ncbi:hypothetical protein, partial [Xanthomonas phaseoli]